MKDPRYDQVAKLLTRFSVKLQKGERVLIDAFEIPDEMTIAVIRAARALGAVPLVQVHHARISRELSREAQEEGYDIHSAVQLAQMKKMHAYIAFRGGDNMTEMSDVTPEKRVVNIRAQKGQRKSQKTSNRSLGTADPVISPEGFPVSVLCACAPKTQQRSAINRDRKFFIW